MIPTKEILLKEKTVYISGELPDNETQTRSTLNTKLADAMTYLYAKGFDTYLISEVNDFTFLFLDAFSYVKTIYRDIKLIDVSAHPEGLSLSDQYGFATDQSIWLNPEDADMDELCVDCCDALILVGRSLKVRDKKEVFRL